MPMMLALLVATVAIKPLAFPAEPIRDELARGEAIYYSHKGVDRVFLEDRAKVGKWFDGQIKRDTDEVIWLSPSLVSRWLGFLNAQEKWSLAELQRRWTRMANDLDGRLTFVAVLYALPKEGFLDLTDDGPTKPETATDTRFLITWPSDGAPDGTQHVEVMVRRKSAPIQLDRKEPEVAPLALFKGLSLDDVDRWPWYALSPVFQPLVPEFSGRKPTPYDGIVGDFVKAIYFIQIPLPEEPVKAGQIQVRVFAPGKQPVAHFDLKRFGK